MILCYVKFYVLVSILSFTAAESRHLRSSSVKYRESSTKTQITNHSTTSTLPRIKRGLDGVILSSTKVTDSNPTRVTELLTELGTETTESIPVTSSWQESLGTTSTTSTTTTKQDETTAFLTTEWDIETSTEVNPGTSVITDEGYSETDGTTGHSKTDRTTGHSKTDRTTGHSKTDGKTSKSPAPPTHPLITTIHYTSATEKPSSIDHNPTQKITKERNATAVTESINGTTENVTASGKINDGNKPGSKKKKSLFKYLLYGILGLMWVNWLALVILLILRPSNTQNKKNKAGKKKKQSHV